MTAAFNDDPATLDRMGAEEFLSVREYVRVNGFRDPGYFHRLRWRMSSNQRAIIAADLALRRRGVNSRNTKDLPPTRMEVERVCGISVGSLDRAKAVVHNGIDQLVLLTATGHVALTTASRVARLPRDEQEAFITRVREGINPRTAAKEGWKDGGMATPAKPPQKHIPMREARYLYVQDSAMRVMGDSFDALNTVLNASRGGLDPGITAEEAAAWRSDLSRKAKSFRRLLVLLKQRQGES
jgi:hypothetical protein